MTKRPKLLNIHENFLDSYNNCPICGVEGTCSCKCKMGDRDCSNGHEWFRCPRHHTTVIGRSDHEKYNLCQCVEGKTFDDKGRPAFMKMPFPGEELKDLVSRCKYCEGKGGHNCIDKFENKEKWTGCDSCRETGYRPNPELFQFIGYIKKWM